MAQRAVKAAASKLQIKSPDIAVVQWVDAYHLEGWQFGEKPEIKLDPCWTIGFVIQDNEDGVLVSQTWCPDDSANLICIPRGMIQKITVLGDLKLT